MFCLMKCPVEHCWILCISSSGYSAAYCSVGGFNSTTRSQKMSVLFSPAPLHFYTSLFSSLTYVLEEPVTTVAYMYSSCWSLCIIYQEEVQKVARPNPYHKSNHTLNPNRWVLRQGAVWTSELSSMLHEPECLHLSVFAAPISSKWPRKTANFSQSTAFRSWFIFLAASVTVMQERTEKSVSQLNIVIKCAFICWDLILLTWVWPGT